MEFPAQVVLIILRGTGNKVVVSYYKDSDYIQKNNNRTPQEHDLSSAETPMAEFSWGSLPAHQLITWIQTLIFLSWYN